MSKRRTQEEYVYEVAQINPNIEVLGQYVDNRTKILHRCKLDGYEWYASPCNILSGYGCKICHINQRRISQGEFVCRVNNINPHIEIISDYIGLRYNIKFKCRKCGNISEAQAKNLLIQRKCNNCDGDRYIEYGVNDLYTIRPDIAAMMEDKDLAHKICCHSGKKVNFICPRCGCVVPQIVANVVKRGVSCKKCGDGISFPEKFIFNLLTQLNIKFDTYKSFEWSDGRIYDVCTYDNFDNPKYILEIHGKQHYSGGFDRVGGRTYLNEIDNDAYKMNLAINNGFTKDRYVVIDCRESTLEYIKNSVEKHAFFKLYDLTNIDWNLCAKNATSSYAIRAMELWEIGYGVKHISNELHLSVNTIDKYLKRGVKIGLCSYTKNESLRRRGDLIYSTNK